MSSVLWPIAMVAGPEAIVWRAERFAEYLRDASKRPGVTAFELVVLAFSASRQVGKSAGRQVGRSAGRHGVIEAVIAGVNTLDRVAAASS